MSANKYSNLPYIVCDSIPLSSKSLLMNIDIQDTAPDIYETEDVFPSAHDVSVPFLL